MSKDPFENVPPFVAIDGTKGLVRDTYSMGIINTDTRALEQHRNQKALMKARINTMNELNETQNAKINKLEQEVEELKELVTRVLSEK